jgi:hypothetical protein
MSEEPTSGDAAGSQDDAQLDALMAAADEQILAAIKRRLNLEAGLADILGGPSRNEPSARQAASTSPAGIAEALERKTADGKVTLRDFFSWIRRRKLSPRVLRGNYLGTVRAESKRPEVLRLDVYATRLLPARVAKSIASIQSAWAQINRRGSVRVLTLDLDECLQAGAELLNRGIEVRVLPNKRDLGSDSLTFHLFETSLPDDAMAIIDLHHGDMNRPVRLKGVAPTEVFRERFRTEWDKARPLESVIVERIRPRSASCDVRHAVQGSIEQAEATGLHLGEHSTEMILPHLAFRDSCSYVFLLGLPGAGKSYVRSRLAQELSRLRIECRSLTDYPYAYRDFLRAVLSGDARDFAVQSERMLARALRALHADIRDSSQAREVTLVEFTRADLVTALVEFDDIRPRSQLIYVNAPANVRQARLAGRTLQPETRVEGQTITVILEDSHLLSTRAERGLYASDNLDRIKASAHWRDRIFEIDNEFDGSTRVDAKIEEFIDTIISPYRLVISAQQNRRS